MIHPVRPNLLPLNAIPVLAGLLCFLTCFIAEGKGQSTEKGAPATEVAEQQAADQKASDQKAADALKSPGWLENWSNQPYMLGDWGGQRSKLSEKYGVNFEFMYYSALPTNLDGGLNTGSVYEGLMLSALSVDTEKLLGWTGGTFYVSSLWIHGQSFSNNFVGDVNVVSLIDLAPSCRLWEMTYEQKFWDGKGSVRFGQMSIDRDFTVPELYNTLSSITLFNQTFFYPTMAFNLYDRPFYPVEDHALSTTPYATPGIRVKVSPEDYYYLQAGIYGGNPDKSYHGTTFNLSDEEGALAYFEGGYRLNMKPGDKGLPGSYKVGGYYHTDEFADSDALQATFGLPSSGISHSGNYGLYALAEQMLFRELDETDPARQGLVSFARFSYAPPDRNFYDWGADGGLVYFGPIPGRDYDSFAVAFSYLSVSSEVIDAQNKINAVFPGALPEADYEAVLEMNYKAQMTAWLTVQTSVQRVFHPGARLATQTPDAWALIVQSSVRF